MSPKKPNIPMSTRIRKLNLVVSVNEDTGEKFIDFLQRFEELDDIPGSNYFKTNIKITDKEYNKILKFIKSKLNGEDRE